MNYFDFTEVARPAVHQRINLAVLQEVTMLSMFLYLFLTMRKTCLLIDPHLRCLLARMTRIA